MIDDMQQCTQKTNKMASHGYICISQKAQNENETASHNGLYYVRGSIVAASTLIFEKNASTDRHTISSTEVAASAAAFSRRRFAATSPSSTSSSLSSLPKVLPPPLLLPRLLLVVAPM
jgi:hypothetical protein